MRYFCICILSCAAILTCPLGSSYALDVTLAWDANTEPDLAGYAIHYGTESGGPYFGEGALGGDSPIDILLDEDEDPDPDVVQFTLRDLPEETYFFAVTASNTTGAESGYSNEASTTDSVTAPNTEGDTSSYSDEASAADPQVSTPSPEITAGGGGGGCFVATAGCEPIDRTKGISLSLALVLLSLGVASTIKKLRRRRTMIVPLARLAVSSHCRQRYVSVRLPALFICRSGRARCLELMPSIAV